MKELKSESNQPKVTFTHKSKESFSVSLDKTDLSVTLRVNGIDRNKLTLSGADECFEHLLNLVKLEFIKLRDKDNLN